MRRSEAEAYEQQQRQTEECRRAAAAATAADNSRDFAYAAPCPGAGRLRGRECSRLRAADRQFVVLYLVCFGL